MNSVFMLTAANLRRHKGATVSLWVMVLIAALLLNLGLLSMTGIATIISRKIAQLDTPYSSVVMSDKLGASRQNELQKFIAGYPGVTQTQSEKVLYFPSVPFSLKNGGSYTDTILVENVSSAGKMGAFSLIGAHRPETDDSIYVPYILKSKGYCLGDSFAFTYRGKSYRFTISGFTEDLMLGAPDTGGIRFFLPDSAYQKFTGKLTDSGTQAVMLNARMKSIGKAGDLYDAVHRRTSLNATDGMFISTFSIDIVKIADSMPVEIGAAMEIAFAFVVALVLLLVVRFRIANSIEEDMRNIGALEAVGYTSRQVRAAFLFQFLFTALLGCMGGIVLSYAAAAPYGKVLAFETGLDWVQPFNMPVNLITLFLLLVLVALVSFGATTRIRRLPVIVALRGGITTHSFRKNRLPLQRSRGPLNFLLALKSAFQNARQNTALVIILAAVSFASVFIFMIFYNFTVDDTAMANALSGETSDIEIGTRSADDAQILLRELPKLAGVSQAVGYGTVTLDADGKFGYGVVSDYSKLRNNQVYQGRYPKHDNEAVIDGSLAGKLHKGIGDTIRITCGDAGENYMITGFAQSIGTLGKGIYITDSGMRRLNPQYQPVTILAYVGKSTGISEEIRTINAEFGSRISTITNFRSVMQSTLGTYESVAGAFAVIIFAVMILIVVLILTLITGTMLVRRRQEFGIEKALGFTTRQLMLQVSVGFLPVALLGSAAGGLLGWFGADPLMTSLFRAMGIMKIGFVLPAGSVPAVCAAITALTFAISMVAARRIRKISPCVLVNE